MEEKYEEYRDIVNGAIDGLGDTLSIGAYLTLLCLLKKNKISVKTYLLLMCAHGMSFSSKRKNLKDDIINRIIYTKEKVNKTVKENKMGFDIQ